MKKILFLPILFCCCFSLSIALAQSTNIPANLIGTFDGRTPCQELAKQLNEPATPDCIKIKWRLMLYRNGDHLTSGTYSLQGFRFRVENMLKGTWQITKGSKADPYATVYKLNHSTRGNIYLLKADDDVFLFLDDAKNIMVGNRYFSYALYRTELQ
ncbi:MAG: hypothetical protein ABIR66_08780 [Saprospiraceae bacterium]